MPERMTLPLNKSFKHCITFEAKKKENYHNSYHSLLTTTCQTTLPILT